MRFFILVTAAFLALSAGLKVRTVTRMGMGVTPLTLVEGLVAIALLLLVMPGSASGGVIARASVPFAIGVLVLSSAAHALRMRAYRRERARTEAGRLATYVKYLANAADAEDASTEEE